MPLVSARHLLAHARQNGYAVPLFDFFEMTGCEDYFRSLEHLKAPSITGMYAATFDKPSAKAFVAALRTFAEDSPCPVALMLDHGSSVEQCLRALDMGFTDVMYDGSKLPFEQNAANSLKVAEAAHKAGAGAEAELGHVGGGNEYRSYGALRKGFTDPASVTKFIAATGVDMLAVAVGTAHGVYDGEPYVDLDLLADIRKAVDTPLVLHGGTGLTETQFRGAIEAGVAKINVATDLVMSMAAGVRAVAANPDAGFFKMTGAMHDAIFDRCNYYLNLFGASGRADASRAAAA
jgi:ketose-bisphosphate aldolase